MEKKIDDVSKKIKASKLVFKINKPAPLEDSIKANNYLLNKHFLKFLLYAIYLGFILPTFCIFADTDFSTDYSVVIILIFAFTLIGLAIGYVISYFLRKNALIKYYKNLSDKDPNKYLISFYKKGLIRQDTNSTLSYLYTDFIKIEENNDFLFFYITNKNCFFIKKSSLKTLQYAFILSIKEELSNSQKIPYEFHKTNKVLGIALLTSLFILGVILNYKAFYSVLISIICAFLLLRLSQIVYERYINYLDTFGMIITCVLSAISVFLGQYLYYVSYYYAFYSINGYKYIEVLFKLFSMIELSSIMTYLRYSVIISGIAFLLNVYFMYKAINKKYVLIDNSKDLEPGTHISLKTKYLLIYILTMLFFTFNVLTFKDVGPGNEDHTIYGYSGYYISEPLSSRYSDQIERLKDINQNAYKSAYNNIYKQNAFVDFNVDNYYINVNNKEDVYVSIYANFDTDNEYALYFDAYDYEDLKTESEWSDWYSIDGENCYIDLNIHATGNGYSVIVISNDYDDRLINIFIDGVNNIEPEPDNSAGPGTMYFFQ